MLSTSLSLSLAEHYERLLINGVLGNMKPANVGVYTYLQPLGNGAAVRLKLDYDDFGIEWMTVSEVRITKPCAFGERCVQKDEPLFPNERPVFVKDCKPHVCRKCGEPLHNLCVQEYFADAIARGAIEHGEFYCSQCHSQ